MNHIQGPGLFLAQFLGEEPPFHTFDALAAWVAGLGYTGVQVPTWDAQAIDLDVAASSKGYYHEYRGRLAEAGLTVIEWASYLQGQVMAMHPVRPHADAFAQRAICIVLVPFLCLIRRR